MVSSVLRSTTSDTRDHPVKRTTEVDRHPVAKNHPDDLTLLSVLNEDAVVEALSARYNKGAFYTWAGITLLAVNPFHSVPDLYDEQAVHTYSSATKDEGVSPHIFQVGHAAYTNMTRGLGLSNQSIIVSGESGAGKTWTARCLMQFITQLTQTQSTAACLDNLQTVQKIERQILDSNPILEAFGNAGTARNANSSRFGKYIQIQFNRNHQIIGARIRTYLLEKTRAVQQAPGERNFHIFYQMLAGCSEQEKESWMLPKSEEDFNFTCLPKFENKFPGYARQAFCVTKAALSSIGVDHSFQSQVFQILAGILHLSNIVFEEKDDIEMLNAGSFCTLLGISEDTLATCLLYRLIKASGGSEQFLKPCSVQESASRRDCLAKLLYARLFEWLVDFINHSIQASESTVHSFIGLLDVYGFEKFLSNGLEQLCINYANEKLQQHFVSHFLKKQQTEYEKECIAWSHVDFNDNRPCLDLLEGRISIFSLLNEECRLNRQTSPAVLAERMQSTFTHSQHVSFPKKIHPPSFTVSHYAGDVSYQTDQLIIKNKDFVPTELYDILSSSENLFVSGLVSSNDAQSQANSSIRTNPSRTVLIKFKSSLEKLLSVLKATTPHYIRCIKPNTECQPAVIQNDYVLQQLVACGVVETIKISAAGYPIRFTYADFLKRYGLMVKGLMQKLKPQASVPPQPVTNQQLDRIKLNRRRSRQRRKSGESSADHTRQVCSALVSGILGNEEDKENCTQDKVDKNKVLLGRTKIFLMEEQLQRLEDSIRYFLSSCAFTIQCSWRRHRNLKRRQQLAVIRIQAGFRGWKTRCLLKKFHTAAAVVQQAFRNYLMKKRITMEQEEAERKQREKEKHRLPEAKKEHSIIREHSSVETSLEASLGLDSSACNSLGWFSSCPLNLKHGHHSDIMAYSPHGSVFLLKWKVFPLGIMQMMMNSSCQRNPSRKLKRKERGMNYQVQTNIFNNIVSIRHIYKSPIVFHCWKSPLPSADVIPCTLQATSRGLLDLIE